MVVEMPGIPFTVAELEDAGVKRVSVGALLARLAYGSLVQAGREMNNSGSFAFAQSIIDYEALESLFRNSST